MKVICPKCGFEEIFKYEYRGFDKVFYMNQCEVCGWAWSEKNE